MDIGLKEIGLSMKQKELSEVPFGIPFLDHLIEMSLKGPSKVYIVRVTVFDGISLRSFEPKDVRNKITIRDHVGKVSLGSGSRIPQIASEGLDVGSKAAGAGSIIQLRNLGRLVLKAAGVNIADGVSTYNTDLKVRGKNVGSAMYTTVRYNRLRDLPAIPSLIVPDDQKERIMGMPVLVSNAVIDLDLSKALDVDPSKALENDEVVEVVFRENVDIGTLSADHGRNVVITAYYDVRAAKEGELPHISQGVLTLELGPFGYKQIATNRKTFTA